MNLTTKIRYLLILIVTVSPATLAARDVVLQPGEAYRDGTVTVRYEEEGSETPIKTTECQYWDDFDKRCLYERTIHTSSHGLKCIEECQHWDSFNKRCDYATTCTYHPDQNAFVRKMCLEFDSFDQKCLREKEEIMHSPRHRR